MVVSTDENKELYLNGERPNEKDKKTNTPLEAQISCHTLLPV